MGAQNGNISWSKWIKIYVCAQAAFLKTTSISYVITNVTLQNIVPLLSTSPWQQKKNYEKTQNNFG